MSPLTIAITAYLFLALATGLTLSETFSNFKYRTAVKIIVFSGLVLFGVWDINNRFNQSDKDKSEFTGTISKLKFEISGLINNAKVENQKHDSPANKIVNNLQPKPYAFLGFSPSEANKGNPFFTKTDKEDSLRLDMYITNYGISKAFDIQAKSFFVFIKDGVIKTQRKLPTMGGNNSMIYLPSIKLSYNIHTKFIHEKNFSDSSFFCVKFDFSDGTGIRKSFTKIIYLDYQTYNFQEASDYDYKIVEKFLILTKIWTIPLSQ